VGGHKVLEVGGEVGAVEAVFPDHPGRQAAQRTVSDRIRNLMEGLSSKILKECFLLLVHVIKVSS